MMKKAIRLFGTSLLCLILLLSCCSALVSCDLGRMKEMVQDLSDSFSGAGNAIGNSFSGGEAGEEETPKQDEPSSPEQGGEQTPGQGGEQTPGQGGEQTPGQGGEQTPGSDDDFVLENPDAALFEVLYNAITGYKDEVDISQLGYTELDLKSAVERFFFLHPELFYIDGGYSIGMQNDQPKKITLTYLYSKAYIPVLVADYDRMVKEIIDGVPETGTDFDKLLYLHDYLVRNYAYDHDGLALEMATRQPVVVRDAYKFLKDGKGVCQAYMLTLIELCNELDIPCLPVTSTELEHAWNLVRLDGEWYHVDLTWDDAGGEQSAVYPSYTSYKYFLLSEQALRAKEGRNVTWTASAKAEDSKYDNALWRDTTTGMIKQGTEYFCVIYDDAINKAHIYRGTPLQMTVAATLENAKWHGADPSSYYREAWSSLVVWGDKIVLNTANSFLYYDAQTNALDTIAEFDLILNKQIFGIKSISAEGMITCVVARDYQGTCELLTYQIPND